VVQANLQLACCLYFHQPLGLSPAVFDELFDRIYEPVLDAIEAHPRCRLNLHFSGNILEHAQARRPAFLDRLGELYRDGRLEVLGGAFYSPVLGAIPDRDALGQLNYTASFYKKHLGGVAQGAWLSLRAWDSSLPAVLAMAGLRYTLLDGRQFVSAGCLAEELDGYYTTERAGRSVALFPLNAALAEQVAVGEDLRGYFKELAQKGRGDDSFRAFALEGHSMVAGGRLEVLLDLFKSESHWLKSELLEHLFERTSSRGRVYIPACAYPALSRWLRPAEAGRRYRELSEKLEGIGVLEDARPMLGSVLWDNVLVKYPEANRLHKRMLRVSNRIEQVRAIVQASVRKGGSGAGLDRARELLKKSSTDLWRAQGHAAYWHGPGALPGIYDHRQRYMAAHYLLSVDRMVDRLLKDSCQENWTLQRADYDADGSEELLVRTPHFSSLLHPGKGGGLWELDLRAAMLPLQTSMSPVMEPEVPRLEGSEICLVFDDDEELAAWEATDRGMVSTSGSQDGSRRRGAFQDRFLGPETTLQNFSTGQFRELGNFAGRPYEVSPVVRPEAPGERGRIILSRSGVVKDVDSTHLLKIDKSYEFDVAHPRLEVGVEILNRSRDSARVWYGLEWTFGIPSGKAEQVTLKATSPDDEETVVSLGDGAIDLGVQSWLEWQDPVADLCIVLTLKKPMAVWWLPVTSDYEGADGRESATQGSTLLLHEQFEIWGEETHTLGLQVDFLKDTS